MRGFDPTLGYQFSTYAVPKIAGEIRRFLRDDGAVKVSRGLREQGGALRAARDRLRETLRGLMDQRDFMLRPPYGMITPSNRARAGAPIILWSVDPEDWSDEDSERQVQIILDTVEDGGIILLHDIYSSSVDTALTVVDELLARGYKFVTVEELFALRGVEPEDGKEYRKLPPQE